jgi:hypothetical protein
MDLKSFEQAVRSADWYYEYSDDYSRYRDGMATVHHARTLYAHMQALGGDAAIEAERIWEKFCPHSATNRSAA